MQTFKNGELALKLRRSYTYASNYALILQFFRMSLVLGNLLDHLSMFRAVNVLTVDFPLSIVSFDKCQGFGRYCLAINIG